MARFNSKKINAQLSFGEMLKSARQEKGLSLKQVSWKLKIPTIYLEALEDELFHQLPAGSYGRHFIKEYAKFLIIDINQILKEYDDRMGYWQKFSVKKNSNEHISRADFLKSKWFVLVTLLIALLIYLGYGAVKLFLKPTLQIFNPPVNFVTDNFEINVTGLTKSGAVLVINGESVVVDQDGHFSQVVALQPGINTITVAARRAYSSTVTLTREVLVNPLSQSDNP